jgi:methionine-rich copper-binding protein CopC
MVKFTGKAQKRTIQSFFTVASTSIPEKVVASSPAKKSKLEDSPHPVASTSADSGPMQAASVSASTSLAQAVPEATSHASKQSRRTVTIRPFESLEAHTYTCPFKTIGACKRSETFSNFKALASHCHAKHRGLIVTPVEGDPLEDGTRKIPCRTAVRCLPAIRQRLPMLKAHLGAARSR